MVFRHSTHRGPELTTIFDAGARERRGPGSVAASCAAHGAVLVLIYLALHAGRMHPIPMESRCCSTALYWSPSAANSGARPQHATRKLRRAPRSVAAPQLTMAQAPPRGVPPQRTATKRGVPSPQPQATMGQGEGPDNPEPALPLFYPSPGI